MSRCDSVTLRPLAATLLPLLALQLACSDEQPEPTAPDILLPSSDHVGVGQFVTSSLRDELNSDGTFAYSGALSVPGRDILTSAEAEALGLAFTRQFGPYIRDALEREHRGSIDFDALEIRHPTLAVESAYEPLTVSTFMPLQKAAGPYYLVSLHQYGRASLSVPVSGYATDFRVENTKLVFPRVYGGEFLINGIDAATGKGTVAAPEAAAQHASQATGALVKSVPTLHSRGVYWSPQMSFWQVELDRESVVRDHRGREHVTNRVYITHDGRLEFAKPNLGHAAVMPVPAQGAHGIEPSRSTWIRLQHRKP